MKKINFLLAFTSCIYSTNLISQKEIFSSKIEFTDDNLSEFYSSFNIINDQVIFIANDYSAHCFDKKTGIQNWEFDLNTKTNSLPYFFENTVLLGFYSEGLSTCIQIDLYTGNLVRTLTIEKPSSQPFFRDSIMFVTAIYEGGNVLAYDLKNNLVIWNVFLGHGCDKKPYYLNNKIIANAEGNDWFELDYNGNLLDTNCKEHNRNNGYVPCVKEFELLTHDNKEFYSGLSEDYYDGSGAKVKYTTENTFVLGSRMLYVLGNNSVIKKKIEIDKIVKFEEVDVNEYYDILKVDETTIWFFYDNILAAYDFKNNKLLNQYDLTKWYPHQIIMDDDNVWLISNEGGQLYGLTLE